MPASIGNMYSDPFKPQFHAYMTCNIFISQKQKAFLYVYLRLLCLFAFGTNNIHICKCRDKMERNTTE